MDLEFLWLILSAWAGHPLSDSHSRPVGSVHRSSDASISTSLSSPPLPQRYGQIISSCTEPDVIALTFDDGPYVYTRELAHFLVENDVRATFFMTGHTWLSIDDEGTADIVREVVGLGHQLGSHTWSHPFLTELNKSAIVTEMSRLERAFDRILGYHPTYMRPPYLFTNDIVLSSMAELGYRVIGADVDTKDWDHDSDQGVKVSMATFARELEEGGSIVLCHEVYAHTAEVLAKEMVEFVKRKRLRAVTVGECLGDSENGWYNITK